MLNTQLLCERVRVPSQSPSRTLWFTQDTVRNVKAIAERLAAEGLKKSASRIVGDVITVALEERLTPRFGEAVLRVIAETDDLPKAKIGVFLPETAWQQLDTLAEKLSTDTKVTPSQVVRALAHMATTQVHDELNRK